MRIHKPVYADVEFESLEDAISAFMDDTKQKKLYDMMRKMHKEDMVLWLEGVLDCAEVFGLDCAGLEYLHDEMMELGEDTTLKMIDKNSVTSAIDPSDKLFLVTIEFDNGIIKEELINAFNERTAKAIADSKYKYKSHTIIDVERQ